MSAPERDAAIKEGLARRQLEVEAEEQRERLVAMAAQKEEEEKQILETIELFERSAEEILPEHLGHWKATAHATSPMLRYFVPSVVHAFSWHSSLTL